MCVPPPVGNVMAISTFTRDIAYPASPTAAGPSARFQ